MPKQNAKQVRETIAKAIKTAKPWLKFTSVRSSGSGSRVSFWDPRPRLHIFDYHEELRGGKRLDYYLTPEGKVEVWEYKSDGGGDGWIRKFVRIVPFSQINLEKVMQCIRRELDYAKDDAETASRRASDIQTALSQI